MISRSSLVALALVCSALRCEAAPLSFNGVELGQKWDAFLKAHPRAEVFTLDAPKPREEQLAEAAQQKQVVLIERLPNQALPSGVYYFDQHSLVRATFTAESGGRNLKGFGLKGLQMPIKESVSSLGSPTFIGTTVSPFSSWRGVILLWTTDRQCAYAEFSWGQGANPSLAIAQLTLIDDPWRATSVRLKTIWPAIAAPNPDDETRQRQVIAMLEEIEPRSTDNIGPLQPAPMLNLWSMRNDNPRNFGRRTK